MNWLDPRRLRQLAEHFRLRGAQIEGKYGKLQWLQAINVIEAFQQCAEELETILNETLETAPQEPTPAPAALCAAAPPETNNPS